MKWKGIELVEITEPQIFDPPEKMLVWDGADNVLEKDVLCIVKIKNGDIRAFTENYTSVGLCAYMHCAKIPEEPKPRRATNRELAKWLAQGKGEWGKCVSCKIEKAEISWWYKWGYESEYLQKEIKVRKWEDSEWHEPDVQYMGLEEN